MKPAKCFTALLLYSEQMEFVRVQSQQTFYNDRPTAAVLSSSDKESESAVTECLPSSQTFLINRCFVTQEIRCFYGTRSLKIIFS
jgi:hypothetical protein